MGFSFGNRKRKLRRKKPLSKTAVLLIGLLFLAAGAWFTYSSYTFARTAIATTGTVTDVEVSRSTSSSGSLTRYYMPTISFLDEQGIAQSAQVRPGRTSYNFPVGTEKRIRYNPNDPSHIKFDSWFALWGFGSIFLFISFGIFASLAFLSPQNKKLGVLQDEPGASTKGTDQAVAFLRTMGRHAEADEVLQQMQSADNDARPEVKKTVLRSPKN